MTARCSIAMTTYYGERFLSRQLRSIAAQSVLPRELVVRDDCSSDGTIGILEAFALSAPFPVRVLPSETGRLGAVRNFEQAIAACQDGGITVLCDQDDEWRSDRLEAIEAAIPESGGPAWFFSDADLIDADDAPLGTRAWQYTGMGPDLIRACESGEAFTRLMHASSVVGATLAFRTETRDLFLPFPAAVGADWDPPWHIHDGWICLVLAASHPAAVSREPLVRYRIHADQVASLPIGLAPVPRAVRDREIEISARNIEPVVEHFNLKGIAPASTADLSARLQHLRARRDLRREPFPRRSRHIVTEWRRGRYQRFSRGWKGLVADTFVPSGRSPSREHG